MKKSIKVLEAIIAELGLAIDQKKESENIYVITVTYKNDENFVIYTTKKMVEHEGESCFRMYQVREKIPFNSVNSDKIKAFIWKYESFCLEKDLPVPSFDASSEEIFIQVYADMIKKSSMCMNKYRSIFLGISAKDVENRIRTVI